MRLDRRRISLPTAHRVSVITWCQILAFGMRPPVHIDGLEAMRTAIVENIDALEFRHFEDLEPVSSCPLPRTRRRFASRVRLVFQEVAMPVIDERSRPRLQRNVVDVNRRSQRRPRLVTSGVDRQSTAAAPKPFFARRITQHDPAVGPAWRGARWPGILSY
jgi:hypothetical protein